MQKMPISLQGELLAKVHSGWLASVPFLYHLHASALFYRWATLSR